MSLDVTSYGAVGDGVTDDSGAFAAALAAVPSASSPWSDSRTIGQTEIVVPIPSVSYHFATEVTIPTTKNVTFRGEGSNGSRITSDADYAFFVDSPTGSFRARVFDGLLFDGCGVRVDTQTRNRTEFRSCMFHSAPDYAIKIQSSDGGLGSSGGVVGGLIADCEFESCAGGIVCQGDQSDGWNVTRCRFIRSTSADIKVFSSGWHIVYNVFEQRPDANLDQPFVNIGEGSTNNILIASNRFGNEVGSGTQPPREAIVIGTIGVAETAGIVGVRIKDNFFRGRSGGATASSANVAIRLNAPTYKCQIVGNDVVSVFSSVIQFAHGAAHDGTNNYVDQRGTLTLMDRDPISESWLAPSVFFWGLD